MNGTDPSTTVKPWLHQVAISLALVHELEGPKPQQARFSLLGQLTLEESVKSVTVAIKAPFLVTNMPL